MKKIHLILIAFLMPFVSFAQTISEETKQNYYSLILQGLYENGAPVSELYRLQVNTIEIETNRKLEYAEKGNPFGIPVILLHGITGSWHSFEKVLPLMPEDYHVFAISQRGHGNSDKNFASYNPKDFANDVVSFITKLKLGPVIIVGHSMGGLVARQFAIDHPQLLKGLVLVDTDASFKDNPGVPAFYAEVMCLQDPIPKDFMDAFQKSTLAKPIDQAFYDTVVAEGLKVPAHIFKAALRGLVEINLLSLLHKINKPTLLLWGDKDSVCPLSNQHAIKNSIKDARLIIYHNTGRALHWEEPQRFVNDLDLFFKTIN